MPEDNQSESRLAAAFKYFLEVLAYPPYYAFFYVSGVFVLAAIITGGTFFQPTFAVFIYSIVGIFWRHIHKDFQAMYNPNGQLDSKINKVIVFVYHIGNILLIALLLYWLSRQGLP